MCGRYYLKKSIEDFAKVHGLDVREQMQDNYYNAAPTFNLPVILDESCPPAKSRPVMTCRRRW